MSFQELVIEIDESNHDDFLAGDMALIHFFSERHMNCLMTLPLMEDIAQEFANFGISFGKLDIDEYHEIARKHKITCVPCIILFRNGEQQDRIENQIQEDILREKISSLMQVC